MSGDDEDPPEPPPGTAPRPEGAPGDSEAPPTFDDVSGYRRRIEPADGSAEAAADWREEFARPGPEARVGDGETHIDVERFAPYHQAAADEVPMSGVRIFPERDELEGLALGEVEERTEERATLLEDLEWAKREAELFDAEAEPETLVTRLDPPPPEDRVPED